MSAKVLINEASEILIILYNQKSTVYKDGNETFTGGQSFGFNDIELDKESLKSGDVTISFMSKEDVNKMVEKSGAGDQNFLSAWKYAATESNRAFTYTNFLCNVELFRRDSI